MAMNLFISVWECFQIRLAYAAEHPRSQGSEFPVSCPSWQSPDAQPHLHCYHPRHKEQVDLTWEKAAFDYAAKNTGTL